MKQSQVVTASSTSLINSSLTLTAKQMASLMVTFMAPLTPPPNCLTIYVLGHTDGPQDKLLVDVLGQGQLQGDSGRSGFSADRADRAKRAKRADRAEFQ